VGERWSVSAVGSLAGENDNDDALGNNGLSYGDKLNERNTM
jgi:hypothetical protein